jgi:photosystem II protein
MAQIEFSRGVREETIPNDVRITRAPSGQNGRAYFYFEAASILAPGRTEEITGMYLIDEEGEIVTREVKGKFINGKISTLEAIVILNSPQEWDRFMRFMERYGQENGLEFRGNS